jgi:hypothetical protein
LKRAVDVSRRRVCGMTRHRDENVGQIVLLGKPRAEVVWGSLPCSRAAGTLRTKLCPCRRGSSAAPSDSCA